MRKIAVIALAFAMVAGVRAQGIQPGAAAAREGIDRFANGVRGVADYLRTNSTESYSGQFVVFAPPAPPAYRRLILPDTAGLISLKPGPLAVSCERIKSALCRTLKASTVWRGRICLDVHAARSTNDLITIVSEKSRTGWNYRVVLPDLIQTDRLERAMVQVLLLEMANRNAGGRTAEIPRWLAEGLARELPAASEIELVLSAPSRIENGLRIQPFLVDARRQSPLAGVQQTLGNHTPLTFDQLSWPTEQQESGEAAEVYRSCAQLFVHQLLHLRDGPACLRALLARLPAYFNWQIAFLHAFHSHFQSALDVEKWWALQLVQFTGRDLTQTWTPAESWSKLDEIIRPEVGVRTASTELPLHTEVSLQTIISRWTRVQQVQLFRRKLVELGMLRVRVAPEMIALVDDYRRVIENYLQKRENPGPSFFLFRKRVEPNADRLARETIAQLDSLDRRRAALRPPSPETEAAVTRSKSAQVP